MKEALLVRHGLFSFKTCFRSEGKAQLWSFASDMA